MPHCSKVEDRLYLEVKGYPSNEGFSWRHRRGEWGFFLAEVAAMSKKDDKNSRSNAKTCVQGRVKVQCHEIWVAFRISEDTSIGLSKKGFFIT
jgi:hypothetical protein